MWDNNEIDLKMNIIGYEGEPTHEECNEARRSFIRDIVHGGPESPDDTLRVFPQDKISSWFSHEGW